MPMAQAAAVGDVFITVTGNRGVVTGAAFPGDERRRDLSTAGHFDVELDVPVLADNAKYGASGRYGRIPMNTVADARMVPPGWCWLA